MIKSDSPPLKKAPLFWADFAEINALFHPEKCFSYSDLGCIEKSNTDNNRKFDAEEQWANLTNFIENRLVEFGESYPFVLEKRNTIVFKWKKKGIQKLYLTLLISSSLRHFHPSEMGEITRKFEEISYLLFSRLMPTNSSVKPTWANGGDKAPYSGTLYEKLSAIANDLRCANKNFTERDFRPGDSGDGGLDIVAWHPMADRRDGMPVAFAQCGCSQTDWTHKQLQAHPAILYRQIPIMHPWANYYFLPLDLRASDGDWEFKNDIGQVILVDRLRIIRLTQEFRLIDKMEFPSQVPQT